MLLSKSHSYTQSRTATRSNKDKWRRGASLAAEGIDCRCISSLVPSPADESIDTGVYRESSPRWACSRTKLRDLRLRALSMNEFTILPFYINAGGSLDIRIQSPPQRNILATDGLTVTKGTPCTRTSEKLAKISLARRSTNPEVSA